MKVYQTELIRNMAIVAHGGAGKTSLVEAVMFNSGVTKRIGRVEDGNTVTDYHPEEIKRQVTINTSLAPCEWNGKKLNIIDTPGYADFIGDVNGALRVTEAVLMVVCAVSGVEVQTEVIWEEAIERKMAKIAFINKMDRENANFIKVLENIKEKLQGKIVPVQIPIGSENSFVGVIDLLRMKAIKYNLDGKLGQDGAIPSEYQEQANSFRGELIEAAAEGDDELLMKYLEGEELTQEEIVEGLKKAIKSGEVVPVLCGSATKNIGIVEMLDFVAEYLPSPIVATGTAGVDLEKKLPSALIFKTLADPYVGKVSYLRVYSGVFKGDTTYFNSNKETDEKVGQVFILQGKNQISVPELRTGDIGAVTKLQQTITGDTLTHKQNPVVLEGIKFPAPSLTVAIKPKSKGDEDKLGNAIARLLEEDTTLRLTKNVETKETLLTGMGELHLDIIIERLSRKFGVEVERSHPKVPYRETIKSNITRIEGKHKKQSGGHGQYGHVFIDAAPLPDKDFEFAETIFGGSVPRQYIPAVEKGIREALNEGILAGYPVTNVKITLTDGSYHTVDSSEMAFKIAAGLAFKKAMEQAKPVLLEPIMTVEIKIPEQFMGDIMGDLNGKRGRILGMERQGKHQVIKAQAPLSEMYRYAIDLKSITQGRGSFSMEFSQYEEVPAHIADRIIDVAKQESAN
jgi:elongation factor G